MDRVPVAHRREESQEVLASSQRPKAVVPAENAAGLAADDATIVAIRLTAEQHVVA